MCVSVCVCKQPHPCAGGTVILLRPPTLKPENKMNCNVITTHISNLLSHPNPCSLSITHIITHSNAYNQQCYINVKNSLTVDGKTKITQLSHDCHGASCCTAGIQYQKQIIVVIDNITCDQPLKALHHVNQ